jgi:protein involved in polysaccharide export with SLBB domain
MKRIILSLVLALTLYPINSYGEIGDPTSSGDINTDKPEFANIQQINTLLRTETVNPTAIESRLDPTQYIISAGDQLLIAITGNIVANYRGTVDPTGKLCLPMLKGEMIGGLNIPEAQRRMKVAYSEYFHDFELTLSVTKVRSIAIHVSGHVFNPGLVTIPVYSRMTSALALSEGIYGNGSYRKIRVIRKNGQPTNYDLRQYFAKGDTTQNPRLDEGDRIFVPKAAGVIKVRGDIYSTFEYERMRLQEKDPYNNLNRKEYYTQTKKWIWMEIINNENVRDILTLMGDTAPTLKKRKILIRRYTKDGFKDIKADMNTVLKDRDELLIDAETSSVFVYGSVTLPGEFDFVPGKPAIFYINLAGGANYEGDMKHLKILDKKTGKYKSLNVDDIITEDCQIFIPLSTRTHLKDYFAWATPVISALALIWTITRQ